MGLAEDTVSSKTEEQNVADTRHAEQTAESMGKRQAHGTESRGERKGGRRNVEDES